MGEKHCGTELPAKPPCNRGTAFFASFMGGDERVDLSYLRGKRKRITER